MPAFLDFDEFYRVSNPELWVAIGLILFVAIVWLAGGFRTALGMLDTKAHTIRANLEEAARLRAEAEAMLADIRKQRDEAEVQGAAMLKEAEAEARRLAAEAKVKLEESIVRRKALAERRIASAETQALADVKAAAADLAAQVAETVLVDRLKTLKSDPQVDQALGRLADRLQ
jgi:F-type H+-transporting ATPase subunit b